MSKLSASGRPNSKVGSIWTPTLAVLTAALVNLPLLYLFVRASEAGSGYAETVFSRQTFALLQRTGFLVIAVLGLAIPLAVALAWLVTRTDLPFRKFWAVAAALPLVFPSYVAAFSWVAIWGPKGIAQGLVGSFGIEELPGWAYGFSGAWLVLSLFTYPYVYLLIVAALRNMDPASEEAARSLGKSRITVFFSVVLPQLKPAVYSGGLLVALYTLSDFGAVSIVRFNAFTLSIYSAYQGLFDRSIAAALATVLVVATLVVIFLGNRLAGVPRPSRKRASRPPQSVPLGRWKAPATAFLVAISTLNLFAPIGVVVHWGLRAIRVGNPIGLAGEALWRSLAVAVLTAVLAVCLSLAVSFWSVRSGTRSAQAVLGLTYSGYALPGLVIALSLVFFSTRLASGLYQTVAILIVAYLVRFLPEAVSATRSSLAALDRRFEEAARSLGSSRLRTMRRVTLPLIQPGLLAGAGLVFLTTMKELPATLILRPTGFETLATRVWTATSDGIYSQAALPALLLVVASSVPVYFLILRPVLAERR